MTSKIAACLILLLGSLAISGCNMSARPSSDSTSQEEPGSVPSRAELRALCDRVIAAIRAAGLPLEMEDLKYEAYWSNGREYGLDLLYERRFTIPLSASSSSATFGFVRIFASDDAALQWKQRMKAEAGFLEVYNHGPMTLDIARSRTMTDAQMRPYRDVLRTVNVNAR